MSITREAFDAGKDETGDRILAFLREHKEEAFTIEEVAAGLGEVQCDLSGFYVKLVFLTQVDSLRAAGEVVGRVMPSGAYYVAAVKGK